ncbi:uncharacterized protein LOC111356049 isoform X1 [Spodoptera litura]|uniref:Uncharacterized protein LOC111356049 isoform X1 n=1 Tax=Spodoptera litura TaxID=69820 RepID=A0A9J7EC72_SPOLT|nr:uncharacterized protein LOC111356049 isoform X1 [Spodoptera litura]
MTSRYNNALGRQSEGFGDHLCPVECITKLLLFIAIVVVILLSFQYIPLGKFYLKCDPECCNSAKPPPPPKERYSSTMCCLCDVYQRLMQVGQVSLEVVELFLCASVKVMYSVKLRFYEVLDMLDRGDLRRSVCRKIEDVLEPCLEPIAKVPDSENTEPTPCCKEKVICKCDKPEKVTCGCKTEKVICECGTCPC